MKNEQKYYRIKQGAHDDDGKYHEFGGIEVEEDVDKYVKWNLAKEIEVVEFFEGKARWGTGHYAFIGGSWICSASKWDSSG